MSRFSCIITFCLFISVLTSCSNSYEVRKECDSVTGEVISEVSYLKGTDIMSGEAVFYNYGNLSTRCSYDSNRLDGSYTKYFEDGTIRYQLEYSSNRLQNILLYYSDDRHKLDFGEFKDGSGYLIQYYGNGEKFRSGNVVNGYPDGTWFLHSEALDIAVEYKDGYKNGTTIREVIVFP